MAVKIEVVPIAEVKKTLTPGARKRKVSAGQQQIATKKTPYAIKIVANGAGPK